MAIVNRTPDSFYDRGATWRRGRRAGTRARGGGRGRRHRRHRRREGRARRGGDRRRRRSGAPSAFVAAVRAAYPDLVISVDTWRTEVAREAVRGRRGPAQRHLGRLGPTAGRGGRRMRRRAWCAPTPAACAPRTRPYRVGLRRRDGRCAATDADAGRPRGRGWGSTRRGSSSTRPTTSARTPGTRWRSPGGSARWWRPAGRSWCRCPTRTSSARRWTAGREERLTGTLAATAVCAWLGARVFRAHQVTQTRQVLDMVSAIRGELAPARAVRGLA